MDSSTDYLVVGAGVSGLAFADSLVAHSDAEVTIVDRRSAPGGHWTDVYPFVRLHSPSTYYGVNSLRLGQDAIDTAGPNAGLYERASADELWSYFREVTDRLTATGRVKALLGHEVLDDAQGTVPVRDRATGDIQRIEVRRRVVDARFLEVSVPATHTPTFGVAADASFAPVHRLPEVAHSASAFTVLGSGKTAVDAVLWLMDNDVDPERIRWVRPREAYVHNREAFQALDLVVDVIDGIATDTEIGARATSNADLVADLEQNGRLIRLDPDVPATMYRGAMLSSHEVDRARQVADVVRLGRVRRVERDRLVLEDGEVPTDGALHVDASASGLRLVPPRPIFAPGRITLQQVRHKTPSFNAALLGWVEANREDDTDKNRLCPPNPFTHSVDEWAAMCARTWRTESGWGGEPDLQAWVGSSRLNLMQALPQHLHEPRAQAAVTRFVANVGDAIVRLEEIAGQTRRTSSE
ncbi:NAD(P)-binding protein [Aeromicrobium sp. NPDC092404]|uniref:NAD(P)-binding protein n=1 Tax=Aeromicrobium sp. NPDC092404 TaxID=3154976 RepID=UPI0034367F94